MILDGRNRLAACEKAGVEPSFVDHEGDDDSARALVISLNIQRRDLTAGQRAVAAAKDLEQFPERRGRPENGSKKVHSSCTLKSRTSLARQFKVNENAIQQARTLLKEAPDLAEQVESRIATITIETPSIDEWTHAGRLGGSVPGLLVPVSLWQISTSYFPFAPRSARLLLPLLHLRPNHLRDGLAKKVCRLSTAAAMSRRWPRLVPPVGLGLTFATAILASGGSAPIVLQLNMEIASETALLPPAPRTIRRRRGYYQLVMQHLSLGVVLMFVQIFWMISVGTVRMLWFSTIVPAAVTKVSVSQGGHGPSYALRVAYDFGGVEYASTISIGPQQAETLKEGDTVSVQVLPDRPDRAELYQENYPYVFVTILLCLFTLLPLAALAQLLWQLYVAPWQIRALMRDGAATSARIVEKKRTSGRCPKHIIAYEYQAPSPETFALFKIRRSMNVQPEDFLKAAVGDEVVVLFLPSRPRKSVIYRYADYEFVS